MSQDGVNEKVSYYDSSVRAPATRQLQDLLLLNGTSWTALNITFNVNPAAQPLRPITLSFGSEDISGSTGCNRYAGSYDLLSDNSFSTSGGFRLTRKYCAQVMAQEMNYIGFLSNRIFFYEIISTGDSDVEYELVLYNYEAGPEVAAACPAAS